MALRLRPDLLLMDVKLEGSLDGYKATKKIRNSYDVPVIYLTGHPDPASLQRAGGTEHIGYIRKPFDERDLAEQIQLALSNSRSE